MKSIFDAVVLHFKKLPMQKKLMYSFAIPAVISCILINLICYPIIFRNYEKQLKYSVTQSGIQAESYISNYVETMYYLSELLIYNTKIHDILSSAQFGHDDQIDNQYREFWQLNLIFNDLEQTNSGYRIGIYVPDSLIYAGNDYYFYQQSELEKRTDYEEMKKAFENGRLYFALVEGSTSANPTLKQTNVALFRRSFVTADGGEERSFVWKVELPLENLVTVLRNASATPNSLLYVLGEENGEILAAAGDRQGQEALPGSQVQPWETCQIGNEKFYVVSQEIEKYRWQLFALIPIKEFHSQSRFIILITMITTISLCTVVTLIAYKLSQYYTIRLAYLNEKMKSLESGDFSVGMSGELKESADEMDRIYENFNFMVEELRRLMKEHYRLGKNVMSAELKALQAQINPHFLYNTLDLINWGAMDYGANQVAELARNLGEFYRISLNKGKSAILIEDELRHVEAYVKIENAHYEGRIHLSIEVPEEIRKYSCLNIILQPFVENAIVHGMGEFAEITETHIQIRGWMEKEDVVLIVSDDGMGMEKELIASILEKVDGGAEKGYGVRNINFRLKLCYGDQYGVDYESVVGAGTAVRVRIPGLRVEELERLVM